MTMDRLHHHAGSGPLAAATLRRRTHPESVLVEIKDPPFWTSGKNCARVPNKAAKIRKHTINNRALDVSHLIAVSPLSSNNFI